VVLLVKLLLDPLITDHSPFLLLAGAVIVGAWFGGLGPGLLATAFATMVANYFFLPPVNSFTGPTLQAVPLVLFALQGLLISSLVAALHSVRQRAEMGAQEARNHQESLRRSEERFRLVVEGVKDYAIFMLDPEGRVATWNEGSERVFGYTAEEIVGKHLSMFIQEVVERGHVEELAIAAEEDHYEEEGVRVRKDGSRFWASVLITALRDDEGNLKGFLKVVRDITERKEAERALTESEQRFRALVQNSSDVITVVDAEGTIGYVSPAVERVVGYRPEELVGKSVFDYVRPDDLNEAKNMFAGLWSRSGVHLPFEFKVAHKDGSWRHAEFIVNNLLDDPNVRGLVVNQRDMTERKEAEKKLRESEKLYRTVVEQAAENIFLVEVKTKRILEANAALVRSLGYTSEELKEMTLYDLVAHDRESIDRNVERVLDEGRQFIGERRYRRKDGTLMDVEVSASSVTYGGREIMCVVAHDTTERKRIEGALRRSLDALLALYETGQILSSSLEREELGSSLLEIVARVPGTAASVIDLPDNGEGLRAWCAFGSESLLASVRDEPEARAARRAAFEAEEERSFELEIPHLQEKQLAGLFLPLRVRDRVVGVLEVYGLKDLAESGAMETFASLANQAASALENARLYEELAEHRRRLQDLVGKLVAAQEEERRRVAYDIHDELAQVAAAASQHLQNFAADNPPDSTRGQEDLDLALKLLQQTVGEARNIVADLRPTVLDDFGLATALRLQVERLGDEGLQVSYEETLGGRRLPEVVETTLFRVAHESLTNVRRHARTDRVHVALDRRGQAVRLQVRDWGLGFAPAGAPVGADPGTKVGLSSMRERVALLGGHFEIHSRPGAGTVVVAEVPLWEETDTQGGVDHGK
jgi:PAS domain S-box-containing protein